MHLVREAVSVVKNCFENGCCFTGVAVVGSRYFLSFFLFQADGFLDLAVLC